MEYWSGVESDFGVANGLVLSGRTVKPQYIILCLGHCLLTFQFVSLHFMMKTA